MNDVRDEALGAMLDRAATAIEAEPVDRLPDVIRRGSRRRAGRFGAIGAAVAVFAGAVSWAGLTLPGDPAMIPANVKDWGTFGSIEENGWTVQVPPSWRVQELPACETAPERIGVVVTNVDFQFVDPRGEPPQCEDRFRFQGFPSEGVVFAFMPVGGRIGTLQPEPNTAFPITPDRMRTTDTLSGGATERFLDVGLDGEFFAMVRRWVGPDAAPDVIEALDGMLASLRLADPAWRWTSATLLSTRVEVRHPGAFESTLFRHPLVIDAPAPVVRVTSPGVGPGRCGPPFWRFLDLGFDRLGRSGVAIVISDATEAWSADYGLRPERFDVSTVTEQGRIHCGGRSYRLLVFRFQDAGRQIVVEAAISDGALEGLEPTPLHTILDSIEISKA